MKTQPMNLNQDQEVKLPPFDVTYSDTQSLALIKDWGCNLSE